ncbi:visual pigment-like receptor peropsin [Haliotis rubra]|uniref:visual pigment-like receptor peropsin n=1 Tax=Haliotis rubra TaxID=36100 RepID=UPI001EE5A83C|nr:visual pigment-like receptor peropsin [Haliotis rubra]
MSGVFGISANVVSVVMFLTEKKLRSSVDILLLNLAIADIGMTGVCFPFTVSSNVAQQWLYGDVGCTIYGFLGFIFGNATISTLSASYWVSVRALFAELGTGINLMVQLLIDMEAAEKGPPRSKTSRGFVLTSQIVVHECGEGQENDIRTLMLLNTTDMVVGR